MSDGYRQVGSFESERVDAVAVGDGAIAVGTGERIVLVTGSDRVELDHGERVVDLAVADRVLVLSADALTVYSRNGDRIRRQPVADAHAIATVPGEGIVGVLGPDRLRAVDVATGRERFDVERTRPGGPADDGLLGTPAGFVIATWSFLTRIDPDGEIGFDRNLEAVVRSLGRCDDAVVAALQNDRLVSAALETGAERWQTALSADHVAPVGESSVLVTTTDGIRAVDPDGETASVPGLSTGDGYATADGSLVCSIRDGTVSTYVHNRDRLRLTVATDAVGVGGTIDVEATNATDRERRVDLAAAVEGATLSPSERTVALEAGETTIVDFPVEAVRSEGERTVELAVDGSVVERSAVELDDAASGGIAVEADLAVTAVDHGVAELEVAVENVGGVALEGVRLLETDAGTESLEPGGTWTGTVTRPYEPDRRVSVGLEVARGDRRREYAPTCTLPPTPTVDVEADGDAVRATVDTAGSVTVVDRLVIELPGAGRVRTEVTIERDELLLVVPQFDEGTARIGFESLDVDERLRLSGGPASLASASGIGGSRSADRDRDRDGPTRNDRDAASSSPPTSESSGRESTAPRSEDGRQNSTGPTAETGLDDESDAASPTAAPDATSAATGADEASTADESGSDSRARDGAAHADDAAGGDDRAGESGLVATRRLEGDSAPVGHAVRDRIELANEGDSTVDVAVEIGESTVDAGRLAAGERTTLERSVAILSGTETTVSPAAISADGTVSERLSDRSIADAGGGVAVRATVDPADGSVVAELVNREDRPRRVDALEIDGRSIPVEARLAAGERTTATGGLDGWTGTNAATLEGTVAIADEDGTARRVDIVAAVASGAGVDAAGDDGDPFRIAIGSGTQVAGEYGTVVLVFENEGERPLADVAVSANGEPINDLFYSEARRERLGPGDRIEHFVDIEPGVSEPSFEATVRYAVDGADREAAVRAAGPATDDEAAWTDDHRERWSVERVETESASPDAPSSLSTPFRRA
ncbi:hypothetical protein A6E15_17065 [Natrinema saccharevitans]|uniref:Uncharacterized protein n=1 Tax=Natrinema saccharevitans TaxID=301967 RepID=A0A1S8B142_9EURY|nr:hypothetical protein [Natrinema saccharevitans]OLZ42566.1 hypothetical protein A6E15_17065 [Natrinema saccharevitans]